jgi:hypothetical protein
MTLDVLRSKEIVLEGRVRGSVWMQIYQPENQAKGTDSSGLSKD